MSSTVRTRANPEAYPPDLDEAAGRLLKLLAEPTRRRIFATLMAGETCNCELVQSLGLAENLVSHHIKKLRLAGFVRERRDTSDARWVHYSLDAEVLTEARRSLSAFLDPARLGSREPICPAPGLNECDGDRNERCGPCGPTCTGGGAPR